MDACEKGMLTEEVLDNLIMRNWPRGEKAVHMIREKFAMMPIIGISAEDRAIQMRDAGANVFLSKPFDFSDLLKVIEESYLLPNYPPTPRQQRGRSGW